MNAHRTEPRRKRRLSIPQHDAPPDSLDYCGVDELRARVRTLELANFRLEQWQEFAKIEIRAAKARERFLLRKLKTIVAGPPAERESNEHRGTDQSESRSIAGRVD
jgi:hypothetical protein